MVIVNHIARLFMAAELDDVVWLSGLLWDSVVMMTQLADHSFRAVWTVCLVETCC